MKQYDNTGKGSLWPNKYWAEGEKGPKWTGKITADRDIKAGEEIPLAVWPNQRDKDTQPVMRLTIDRWKEQKGHRAPKQEAPAGGFEDDIPFAAAYVNFQQ